MRVLAVAHVHRGAVETSLHRSPSVEAADEGFACSLALGVRLYRGPSTGTNREWRLCVGEQAVCYLGCLDRTDVLARLPALVLSELRVLELEERDSPAAMEVAALQERIRRHGPRSAAELARAARRAGLVLGASRPRLAECRGGGAVPMLVVSDALARQLACLSEAASLLVVWAGGSAHQGRLVAGVAQGLRDFGLLAPARHRGGLIRLRRRVAGRPAVQRLPLLPLVDYVDEPVALWLVPHTVADPEQLAQCVAAVSERAGGGTSRLAQLLAPTIYTLHLTDRPEGAPVLRVERGLGAQTGALVLLDDALDTSVLEGLLGVRFETVAAVASRPIGL